jgi:hypothetical protein
MSAFNPTMAGHLSHGSWGMEPTMFTHNDGLGAFTLGACDVCHLLIAECLHLKCSWRDEADGQGEHIEVLRCDVCGVDGT